MEMHSINTKARKTSADRLRRLMKFVAGRWCALRTKLLGDAQCRPRNSQTADNPSTFVDVIKTQDELDHRIYPFVAGDARIVPAQEIAIKQRRSCAYWVNNSPLTGMWLLRVGQVVPKLVVPQKGRYLRYRAPTPVCACSQTGFLRMASRGAALLLSPGQALSHAPRWSYSPQRAGQDGDQHPNASTMPHQLSNGHAAARQPAPLRTSLRALFRHKKKALLWFVVTVGGAGLWTAYGPKTYRSDSKLFVRLGRESVTLDPTATTGQVVSITESRESEMNSIYEMLHNRELYVAVALEVGPEEILGLPEPAPEATPVDAGGVNTETAAVEAGAWGKMADWGRNAFQSFVESLRGMNGATEEAKLLDGAVRKLENSLHLAAVRKSSIVSVACDARTPSSR